MSRNLVGGNPRAVLTCGVGERTRSVLATDTPFLTGLPPQYTLELHDSEEEGLWERLVGRARDPTSTGANA